MQGVPHHLIDVLDPKEDFNVVLFQKMAKTAMEDIWTRGHIPILTGGTGFYIQALLYDIDFTENEENVRVRAKLETQAIEEGPEALHARLAAVDPKAAEEIHANNVKRVIRALEYYELTGERISSHNEEQREKTSPYNFAYFVLNDDREKLYARIDQRVDEMMKDGLVKEVQSLKNEGCKRGMVSMQGLGYKEILDYLDGVIPLEEAVRILKRDTRHFAKRQLTWFRRERDVIWVEKPEYRYDEEKILAFMLKILKERGILK